jgi:hypothetical protein
VSAVLAAAAGALGGVVVGVLLGHRWAVAARTYRDARMTTRTARGLWRQLPRDGAKVANVLGGLLIVTFLVVAYLLGRR